MNTIAMIAILLLTLLLPAFSQRCLPQSQGQEFAFAYPPNVGKETVGLFILPVTDRDTTVTVRTPLTTPPFSETIPLPSGAAGHMLTFPSTLTLVNRNMSDVTPFGVRVSADNDVSVVAFNHLHGSADTFTVVPITHTSNEYFAAVYPGLDGYPASVDITSISEPTLVTIMLTAPVSFRGVQYDMGSTITHVLNADETLQLVPTTTAFTGTRIVTNTSVVVVAGTSCANIPPTVSPCDHLAQQLIPFDRWGKTFTISPFARRTDGYVYQIVAGRDNTVVDIVYDNGDPPSQVTLDMGGRVEYDVASQMVASITATKPIQLTLYPKTTVYYLLMLGDAAMLVVPPHEQFVNRVKFVVPQIYGIKSIFASVTAPCAQIDDVLLDGVPLRQITASEEYPTGTPPASVIMCTRWYAVNSQTYIVSGISSETGSGSDVQLVVAVFGYGPAVAFSHYPGFNNLPLTCSAAGIEVECSVLASSCTVWDFDADSQITVTGCAEGANVTSNTTCTFSCASGYELQGISTTTCVLGGYFSGCPPTCLDVDECLTTTNPCTHVGEICVNTPGSFQCDCLLGWTRVGDTCVEHHFIGGDDIITMTDTDVVQAYQAKDRTPLWTFNTSVGRRIRFNFRKFEFNYGYLDIGDGPATGENTRLVRFWNDDLPSDVLSISNAAWLQVSLHRVSLDLTVDITSTPADAILLEEDVNFSITTPNHPNNYPNNAFQLWDIRVPDKLSVLVHVESFNTELAYDFLLFGDGVDKFSIEGDFCNNWKRFSCVRKPERLEDELTLKASSFKIMFSSDGYFPRTGFSIRMRAFSPKNRSTSLNVTHYYSVPENSSLVISTKSDESMNSTMTIGKTIAEWTSLIFETSVDHRIKISFEHICFKDNSEILEIGDGSHIDHDTRLTRFSVSTLPSDTLSVSNAAWIKIHFPNSDRLLHVRIIVTSVI